MQHKFQTTLSDLEVTVVAHLSKPVPPTFDDPGDPGERSVEVVLLRDLKTGKDIDITDALRAEDLESLADEAYEDASNDD